MHGWFIWFNAPLYVFFPFLHGFSHLHGLLLRSCAHGIGLPRRRLLSTPDNSTTFSTRNPQRFRGRFTGYFSCCQPLLFPHPSLLYYCQPCGAEELLRQPPLSETAGHFRWGAGKYCWLVICRLSHTSPHHTHLPATHISPPHTSPPHINST